MAKILCQIEKLQNHKDSYGQPLERGSEGGGGEGAGEDGGVKHRLANPSNL